MNLHYTAILALLAVGTANGQWAHPRPLTPTLGVNEQGTGNLQDPASTGKGHQGIAKAAGDTVFYDDFANGLAGNNNVGAWSRGGPNGIIWKYDTDGPLGAFSNATEIITSTTAAVSATAGQRGVRRTMSAAITSTATGTRNTALSAQ